MGGKSTFMRAIGLCSVLAHMGCFVPATSASIPLLDRILTRVGTADSIVRGASTFMIEMIETAAILNQATERSFVILDEIGRGTSTQDGYAIARSTLEYIHSTIQCRALFATHYHELVALKTTLPHLYLAHMAIKEWQESIVFLHTILSGPSDKSYGIHVASLAGLPAWVLQRAQELLHTLENDSPLLNPLTVPHLGLELSAPCPALPLFDKTSPQGPSLVEQKLSSLSLDSLTPKDALNCLYDLKAMILKQSP